MAAGGAKPDRMGDLLRNLARAAGWIDAYYDNPRRYPVLSRSRPGELTEALPASAPEEGEPFDRIFADFERLIVPGITHWNHPRFFAYFAISSAPIAVVAEALTAALDVNAMLWRTSPAATELEEVVLAWLRELLGLPPEFAGIVYDTASISGFTALAAARESLDLGIRERGMAGRGDLPVLRVYLTEHTHSHIEKAALALGLGRANVVRVPVDENFAMRPEALDALLRADLAAGMRPMCVAATVGTTSATACDPVPAIGEIARAHGVWLHVDAAYAGPAAILPEFRYLLDGCARADSLVVNPHKWMFVPIDFSVLYVREPEIVRRAFSLVAEYLETPESGVRNYMDYGCSSAAASARSSFGSCCVRTARAEFANVCARTSPSPKSSRAGSARRRTGNSWRRIRSRSCAFVSHRPAIRPLSSTPSTRVFSKRSTPAARCSCRRRA